MYKVPRVPGMKCVDAERWGYRIVREYRPDLLENPAPFPVPDFFEFHLYQRYGLKPGVADLGPGLEGLTDPQGHVQLAAHVYEGMHEGRRRARFTPVHEASHGIVHLPTLQRLNCRLVEGKGPELYRREDIRAFEDPEWQANRIAGSILMPVKAVRVVVENCGKDPRAIADVFQVSLTAAQVRINELEKLGWL